ncbi:uncharacterized protein LOC143503130 [Brachyhypopomus gauderio]|uniref:uncharacterized protein LOC143503130 n=1 Tax=Brachyhypopomus gauderio TaxID=698409 RepID=UPI0040431670
MPAPCDLLPSAVLVFRLLSMPGVQGPVSGVVAWGVFPVCGCSLTLAQGTFRTPLLWGGPQPTLDHFSKIEQLLAADLDNWLCNLYFQVRRVPRGGSEEPPSALRTIPSAIASEPAACSSTSLPAGPAGVLPVPEPASENANTGPCAKSGNKKKTISARGCVREMKTRTCFTTEELQHFTFSTQSQGGCPSPHTRCCGPGTRLRLVRRLLPGELGLSWSPRPRCNRLQLALVALVWFPRLYLHYFSQWLYLHAQDVPVNRFRLHAHTVDVVYQGSLLSVLQEMLLVVLGPLTLNAATFCLLLIRWVCQRAFGSTPSFLSKLIMAVAVWTVLDPVAVFAVDAGLGHLSYSAEEPVADAAKLYWHFHRIEQSGVAGIFITLFLYAVHFTLSVTVLSVYLLRLHNDGRILDVHHRLHCPEGAFFIPDDFEVSNQELSYIVKKAEQWRGFNGERRKVAVHEYIWTEEEPGTSPPPGGVASTVGEKSTHVSIYTLYVSGLRQRYRQFLRQPNGAIIEVTGDPGCAEAQRFVGGERMEQEETEQGRRRPKHTLRERKWRRPLWPSNRVGPVGASD